jgi:DNA-binding transcriptional MocR family regulator
MEAVHMDHSHAISGIASAPGSPESTLGERLAAHYAQRIGQRLLQPGARLPSVRDCARAHGVSPSTVVAAYDRLQARGLVEARRQRGFFVRPASAAPTARVVHEPSLALPAPVDAAALIRAMFRTRASLPGPGLGTLPETWLDPSLLQRALRRAMTDGDDALRYGEPAGDPGLRGALARRLSGELGIACDASQIVTAVGATHALDVIARTLLKPGDAVLVDDPGWAVEHARLTSLGMRLLPVPRGVDGPDLNVMATLAREHRPRLYVTVSVLHNPT